MSVPLLFLHGWAMNGAIFDDIRARLGAGYDCHAPDLPGHGARVDEEPSLDHSVAVTRQMILRLDRPVVIGWSMGAAAAWRYIAQYGTGDLRGLITVDMSPRLLPDHDWRFGLRGQTAEQILATSAKIEPHWQGMVGNILRNMFAKDYQPASDGDALESLLIAQDPKNLRPLWDELIAFDARETVAAVDIPYLVCAGANSRLYDPDVAHWIAGKSLKAQVAIFENSGHSPHLEEPEAFCDAIRHFVADHIEDVHQAGASASQ